MNKQRVLRRVILPIVLGIIFIGSPIAMTSSQSRHVSQNHEIERITTVSDDYHSNHNFVVPVLDHQYISWNLYEHAGIYGSFEVTSPASGGDKIISFFICDQENYDIWDSGQTASVYELQENVGSYSFHFRTPHADTWYLVFVNHAVLTSKTINLDLYRDDTPPSIDMNLDAGASYAGIKEITASITEAQFNINSVDLYIDGFFMHSESDSSFSYSWDTTGYSNGAHTVRIVASDNVGNSGYEEVTVYVSNAVTSTTPTTSAGGGGGNNAGTLGISPDLMLVAAIGIVALIVVAGIVARSRGGQ